MDTNYTIEITQTTGGYDHDVDETISSDIKIEPQAIKLRHLAKLLKKLGFKKTKVTVRRLTHWRW